jgi:hypothetical protein
MYWFRFVITYCLQWQQGTPNELSHRSYLVPKEGDAAYNQQCDTIFKLENLQLQDYH